MAKKVKNQTIKLVVWLGGGEYMAKFNVYATLTTTMSISQQIEANSLQEATMILLRNSQTKDWQSKQELKTHSK